MAEVERAAVLRAAGESIARGSRSFALASRLFAPDVRERAWLLYAWCRACDDLIDGQTLGGELQPVDDPAARLALVTTLTEDALAGRATGRPAFDALGIVAREVGLPPRLPRDLLAGFALDTDGFVPADENDLLRYCYHVAGAVGVMMAIVMGVSPRNDAVLDRACDLGLAFQLANIARDVGEDHAAGRCYLPLTWLDEAGIAPATLMLPMHRERLAGVARRLTDLAQRYEASARLGTRALTFRSAWAVEAAAGIYGDIARLVARRGAAAWDERATTSKGAKLAWVGKASVRAARRGAGAVPPRPATLWRRPA